MKKILLLFILILGTTNIATAEQDWQSWTSFVATGKFPDSTKWNWNVEAQPRVGDNITSLERLLLRPSVGYNLNSNLILWLGYGWTPLFMNSKYEQDFINENRLWQQVTYNQDLTGFNLFHRWRLEERKIDGISEDAYRFRYFLKASKPLFTFNESSVAGLAIYDEYFYNLNAAAAAIKSGFDRNRLFFGPYWSHQQLRIDCGYLWETSERLNNSDRQIHALAIYLFYTFK